MTKNTSVHHVVPPSFDSIRLPRVVPRAMWRWRNHGLENKLFCYIIRLSWKLAGRTRATLYSYEKKGKPWATTYLYYRNIYKMKIFLFFFLTKTPMNCPHSWISRYYSIGSICSSPTIIYLQEMIGARAWSAELVCRRLPHFLLYEFHNIHTTTTGTHAVVAQVGCDIL